MTTCSKFFIQFIDHLWFPILDLTSSGIKESPGSGDHWDGGKRQTIG